MNTPQAAAAAIRAQEALDTQLRAEARRELLADIDGFLRASTDWEGKPDRVASAWADVIAANFDETGRRP